MGLARGHELVAGPEALTLDIHVTYIFRVNRFPVGYRHKRSCTVFLVLDDSTPAAGCAGGGGYGGVRTVVMRAPLALSAPRGSRRIGRPLDSARPVRGLVGAVLRRRRCGCSGRTWCGRDLVGGVANLWGTCAYRPGRGGVVGGLPSRSWGVYTCLISSRYKIHIAAAVATVSALGDRTYTRMASGLSVMAVTDHRSRRARSSSDV